MFFNIPIVLFKKFTRIMVFLLVRLSARCVTRKLQLVVNECIHDSCHSSCPGRKMEVAENQSVGFYGLDSGHVF